MTRTNPRAGALRDLLLEFRRRPRCLSPPASTEGILQRRATKLTHVLISLAAILLGLVAVFGMIAGRIGTQTNNWFLIATIATSVTGFFFPVTHFMPSHALGILSLITLTFSVMGLRRFRSEGHGLRLYVITAVIALYLNVFVLVVQLFRKVPVLNALAPTQTELAFGLAQFATLLAFITLGILAVKGTKRIGTAGTRAAAVA